MFFCAGPIGIKTRPDNHPSNPLHEELTMRPDEGLLAFVGNSSRRKDIDATV